MFFAFQVDSKYKSEFERLSSKEQALLQRRESLEQNREQDLANLVRGHRVVRPSVINAAAAMAAAAAAAGPESDPDDERDDELAKTIEIPNQDADDNAAAAAAAGKSGPANGSAAAADADKEQEVTIDDLPPNFSAASKAASAANGEGDGLLQSFLESSVRAAGEVAEASDTPAAPPASTSTA